MWVALGCAHFSLGPAATFASKRVTVSRVIAFQFWEAVCPLYKHADKRHNVLCSMRVWSLWSGSTKCRRRWRTKEQWDQLPRVRTRCRGPGGAPRRRAPLRVSRLTCNWLASTCHSPVGFGKFEHGFQWETLRHDLKRNSEPRSLSECILKLPLPFLTVKGF